MSYRGMQPRRMILQAREVMHYAGHTIKWREYVSATTANDLIGLGDTYHYREQLVSAHMTFSANSEAQTQGGQIPSQTIYATSDYKFGSRDELVWDGVTYRVESDPMPARAGNQYTVKLRRGD